MIAVSQNGDKPPARRRGPRGQFLPGTAPGPGRPPGPNKTTITGHVLRRRIFECWDRIDGNRRLAEWAKENFGEFLKVVVRLLPRNIEIEGGVELAAGSAPKSAADFLAVVMAERGRPVEQAMGEAQGDNGRWDRKEPSG